MSVSWGHLGIDAGKAMDVRDVWAHETHDPVTGGYSTNVPAHATALLRLSESGEFPIPPLVGTDSAAVFFESADGAAKVMAQEVTLTTAGTDDAADWDVEIFPFRFHEKLDAPVYIDYICSLNVKAGIGDWCIDSISQKDWAFPGERLDNAGWVRIVQSGSGTSRTFNTVVNASNLGPGRYRALIKLRNKEPRTGMDMSLQWYDVEIAVHTAVSGSVEWPSGPDGFCRRRRGATRLELLSVNGRPIATANGWRQLSAVRKHLPRGVYITWYENAPDARTAARILAGK